MSRNAYGAEFDGADGFLDSATVGLPPRFVADGLRDCIRGWESGALKAADFDEPVHASRVAYAALCGVPVDTVAMGSGVSGLLGLVAAAIPDGARVATLRGEFTSVTFPFAAQAGRGVTVTELGPGEFERSAGDYDIVAASLVQSADGAVLDLPALRAAVADSTTVTVIDVTQALGWLNVDLPWVDVVVAAGYKWLLAPRGVAWMSVRPRVGDTLVPHAANWWAAEQPWATVYGLPLRLAPDARRFDVSPAWFSVFGAGLSVPWLAGLDRAAVQAHTVGLADRVRTELRLPGSDSAIVSIPVEGAAERLARAGLRASVRAGAARVGFHIYNTDDDVDRLLAALAG